MGKIKELLARILVALASKFLEYATKLKAPKVIHEEENLFELGRRTGKDRYEDVPLEHPTFGKMSFIEALNSPNYAIRHSMASSLINWYIGFEKGEVTENMLQKCAEVTLEGIGHTVNDELELVTIWNKSRNATNEIEGNWATDEEKALYVRLEDEFEQLHKN